MEKRGEMIKAGVKRKKEKGMEKKEGNLDKGKKMI